MIRLVVMSFIKLSPFILRRLYNVDVKDRSTKARRLPDAHNHNITTPVQPQCSVLPRTMHWPTKRKKKHQSTFVQYTCY